MPSSPAPNNDPDRSGFPSTSWTLVRKVQKGSDADAARAMEEFCRAYWYPIYAYARRFGFGPEDAEDVTQHFFQSFLTHESIQAVREEKGRLRNFMLAMLKRIISKQLRHDTAGKRGGSRGATVSFDDMGAEERYAREPADIHEPDAIFNRAWAEEVLATATEKLRNDYEKADNTGTFEQLRNFLPLGDQATPYPEAAAKLGINEATLRLQIHRMRKRYARLIEQEIAATVSDKDELKRELEHLMAAMGR